MNNTNLLDCRVQICAAVRRGRGVSLLNLTPEEKQAIEAQIKAIVDEAVKSTDQVNEIYKTISKDLNPSTILYSVILPV